MLLPAALLAFWYARRLRARHLRGPDRWRAVWFSLGLAAIALAIETRVDRLGEHHFTFRMVQHDLFIPVGAPATVLRGMPQSLRRRVVTPLARSGPTRALYRGLTYSPVSAGVLAAGFIFWLPSIDSHPFRSRLGYGQRLVYQAPMIGARVALGLILVLSGEPLYDGYADVRPVVAGLTGMVDQEYGVAMMWIFGIVAHVTAVTLLFDALTKGWGQSGAADAQRGERSSAAPEQ